MQIRIGNKQDEDRLHVLVQEICSETGRPFDLEDADQDLKNVEAQYFGKDGIFLVVEEQEQVVGLAGANKHNDDVFVVRRICLRKDWRRKGVGRQLVKIILAHGKQMGFQRVEIGRNPFETGRKNSADNSTEDPAKFFAACGFPQVDETTASGDLSFAPFLYT